MARNFKIISLLLGLRTSFWFLPVIMVALSFVLAALTVYLDENYPLPAGAFGAWYDGIGAAGARTLFSTIAGSTITVTGVIFSIAMVVLTMASSQFGPRLIPTFMRTGSIQFGFGMFLATFIYALLMLALAPADAQGVITSHWSVVAGLLLGILSFLFLIFLVHEIATFVQAPNVAARVASDIRDTFERVFPVEQAPVEEDWLSSWQGNYQATELHSTGGGYLRTIDHAGIANCAAKMNVRVHVKVRPGHHVIPGGPIATVFHSDNPEDAVMQGLLDCLGIGTDRTLAQDTEYAVDQMNEIALRALSPGINDPFTAINCIDKLGDALAFLARRHPPGPVVRDAEGEPRVVAATDSYRSIVDSAFDQIRQNGRDKAAVMIRLLAVLASLGELELPNEFLDALRGQFQQIADCESCRFEFPGDQEDFERQLERTRAALGNQTTANA